MQREHWKEVYKVSDESNTYPVNLYVGNDSYFFHPSATQETENPHQRVIDLITLVSTRIVLPGWNFIALSGGQDYINMVYANPNLEGISEKPLKRPFIYPEAKLKDGFPDTGFFYNIQWGVDANIFDKFLEPNNLIATSAFVRYGEISKPVTRGLFRRTQDTQIIYAKGVGTVNISLSDYEYEIAAAQTELEGCAEDFRDEIRPLVKKLKSLKSKSVPNPEPLFPTS
jgi:hypothetical protein